MDYNANYYNEDRRVGDQCFFGDKDVYIEYNADLKEFFATPGGISSDYGKRAGLSGLQLYHIDADPIQLNLVFYVGGPSIEAAQTNVSNLLLAARQCVIRKEGDIYEYDAVLTDRNSEDTGVEPYQQVSMSFAAIRRRPLVKKKMSAESEIYNPGNVKSGVKISLYPETALDTVTVMGNTINDLEPGIAYVIDGISGRVTADGVNYFSHTDIIEFPKLDPGWNHISLSPMVPATIEFYPVYDC